jgi:hypothetical protein
LMPAYQDTMRTTCKKADRWGSPCSAVSCSPTCPAACKTTLHSP